MQFSSILSASLALLAAQVQARAISHSEQARQIPGGLGGVTSGLGGVTGGAGGAGGALGGVTGGLLGGGAPEAERSTDTEPPSSTSSSGNTYYCCSTAPGSDMSLASIVANVNCPQIPVLNIVDFFNTCSTDNHRVTCDPSQSGVSNNGLLNAQCTINVPIQID